MELKLHEKVAIVTGGSKGIGRAIALALAQEGVDVAICARGTLALEEAANDIQSNTGSRVLALTTDVTHQQDVRTLIASTIAELGSVDILVNNAVNSVPGAFMELPDGAWQDHFNVKVMGYIRCAREVIPHMKAKGWGRIINIAGDGARSLRPYAMSNGVTNAGLTNLTKNLSSHLAGDGILVNCVHPASTMTDRLRGIFEQQTQRDGTSFEEVERNSVRDIPLGRMIKAAEIADLVLFLASDKASAITGQAIAVDGGIATGIYY